jgi:hypothetical protein
MATVKFVSEISRMGDRVLITVPKRYHSEALKLKGKQIRVVCTDEFF